MFVVDCACFIVHPFHIPYASYLCAHVVWVLVLHESSGYYQGEQDAYTHKFVGYNWTGYDWFHDGQLEDALGQWELPLLRDAAVRFITAQGHHPLKVRTNYHLLSRTIAR